AVARVNRVDGVALGQLDDLVLGQIGGHRLQPLTDQGGLVGLVAMEVDRILLRKDRYGAEAQLGAGAEDPNRDLTTVGTQDAAKGGDGHRDPARVTTFGAGLKRRFSTTTPSD